MKTLAEVGPDKTRVKFESNGVDCSNPDLLRLILESFREHDAAFLLASHEVADADLERAKIACAKLGGRIIT